MGMLHPF